MYQLSIHLKYKYTIAHFFKIHLSVIYVSGWGDDRNCKNAYSNTFVDCFIRSSLFWWNLVLIITNESSLIKLQWSFPNYTSISRHSDERIKITLL